MTTHLFSDFGTALLNLVLPPRCEVCGTLQEPVVCMRCRDQFATMSEPFCTICGLPLDPLAKTQGLCADCRQTPPPFDAARAGGIYGSTLRHAIHVWKYDLVPALAQPLGDFVTEHMTLPFPVDCLCPVPLYPARERMRGFNQSDLLATRLAYHWRVPVISQWLRRTVNTTPQMQLPREQRRENVKGAFAAQGVTRGATIGLIDDVYTTGATLRECSRVLKRAGAARVVVVTLARTLER